MKTPEWSRTIGQVLMCQEIKTKLVSKSGKEYTTEVIPKYPAIAIGSATEKKDSETGKTICYEYEVYDQAHDLGGFKITAPNLIEIKTVRKVEFENVRGGALSGRPTGWFKADRILAVK